MNNALILIKDFFNSIYIERNIERALSLLDNDIHVFTASDKGDIHNITEARELLTVILGSIYSDVELSFSDEYCLPGDSDNISDNSTAILHVSICYNGRAHNYRLTASTIKCKGGTKLGIVHLSISADESARLTDGHDPIIRNLSCGLAVCEVSVVNKIKIAYINEEFFKICQWDRDALTEHMENDPLFGIHPDDKAAFSEMMAAVIREKHDTELNYRYITGTNNIIWVNLYVKVDNHSDGSMTIYSTYFDISDEIETQQNLSNIIHTIPCGICVYRWDGKELKPLLSNTIFNAMLGDDAVKCLDRVGGLSSYKNVHPDDAQDLLKNSMDALNSTHVIDYTFRLRKPDGDDYMWIRQRGNLIEQPDRNQLVYVTYIDVTDERKAELLLRENDQMLEFAAEYAGLWYWRYDIKTKRATIDEKTQKQFGLPAIIDNYPQGWIDMGGISTSDSASILKAVEQIDNGERQVITEAQTIINGSSHWARFCFTNLLDADGNNIVTICTAVLIDTEKELWAKYELERARPTLDDGNLLVHALFNLTTGQTLEYNYVDGTPVPESNRDAFMYSRQNANNLLIDEEERNKYLELNDIDSLLEKFSRGIDTFRLDYRRLLISGYVQWVRSIIHIVRDPRNSDILLFEYWYDIEEEKLRELMLRSLASESYDYVARIDGRNNSFVVFPRLNDGYRIPPLSGSDIDSVSREISKENIVEEDKAIVLENTLVENIKTHLEDQEHFRFVYREIGVDGNINYKRITQYYLDRQRQIILMTREDVSEIIRAEASKNEILATALEAAKLASMAKSAFLSRMSHELRTPMNAIIGLAALGIGEVNNPAAMENTITKIGMSARYLLSLINDILEMSRIESGRMTLNETLFDFEALISSVNNIIYEQAAAKNIDYDAIVNGYTEPSYISDETKLQQILINVLGNAVKFTGSGGKITFTIEQIRRTSEHACIRFTIADTGVGIDKEFLPHIFDSFSQESDSFTSTSTGTGLGLAITKSIVEMMNGSITVQSIKDVGSVFIIELQVGISDESRRHSDLIKSLNLSKMSALVVDDDVVVCQTTERSLSDMGLNAEWVDNGRAAIELVTERHNSYRDFDTIFIDWKMPDMDGIETTRQIRKIVGPDVTIIIMTAYDWRTIETMAREAGVDMFMEKPLFQSSIIAAFEKIFAAKKDKVEIKPERSTDKINALAGFHIMLAEDHPLNVEVAKRLLEKAGATVTVANNGLEALELFTTAEEGYYDAILMDVRMPVMDGLSATKNIRNLKKSGAKTIPIIAMTANAFDEDVEQSLASGMNAHLIKPIEPNVLFTTLKKLIDEK